MISRILAAALLCVAFGTGAAQAQTLTHRIDTLSGWGGAVNGFQRAGTIGYCGSGQRLVVLDMSNEATIHEIGSVNLEGTVEDLVVRGDYVYATAETLPYRIVAVNVASPSAPQITWMDGGTFSGVSMNSPRRLWLCGDTLYVNNGPVGGSVGAFSLANPARPGSPVARIGALEGTVDMQIVGTLAYAATNLGALKIFSVQNPLQPVLLGSTQVTGCGNTATCVTVEGTRALVQARDFCRPRPYFSTLVNISNPANPTVILGSGYDQFVTATHSAIYGNYALVSDWASPAPCGVDLEERGLVVIDYSIPSSPTVVGSYRTNSSAIRDVRVQGNRAYLFCDGQGLEVIDLSNPPVPARVGGYFSPGLVRGCWKAGSRLYVSDAWNGFTVLDVSNPGVSPPVLGIYRTPQIDRQDHQNIVVRDHVAYLAGGWSGIHIVDVSNPASMTLVRHIPGPEALSNFVQIDLDGGVLHASVGSKPSCCSFCTSQTYRNYDAATGTELSWAGVDALTRTMASKDQITYYPGASVTGDLFDNTASPPAIVPQFLPGGSDHRDLALAGHILLVGRAGLGGQPGGAFVMDVTNAALPQELAFIAGADARAVAIQGNRAYLSAYSLLTGTIGTMAFDLSAPAAPSLTAYSYGGPWRLHADGDLLYATTSGEYGSSAEFNQGLVIRRHRCAADMDDNGVLNVNDFIAFQSAYAASDFRADIDRNQALNVNDFIAYLSVFAAGCD